MSATTAATPRPIDLSATPAVPMSRLAKVEVRKALDTRAGRWLAVAILALVVVVMVIFSLAADDATKEFSTYLAIAGGVLGYFLPIIVIMLVTSEASQRNGLVTFTLEPRRSRVVIAKFIAGVLLGVAIMVLALALAVLGQLLGVATGGTGGWSVEATQLFNGFVLANLIGSFTGFAIATLLMNTPAAIVVYFAYTIILPSAAAILSALSSTFEDIAPWIEFNTAQMPLLSGDGSLTGQEWAQFAVAGTIWLVVPLVIGIRRLLRIEFK